VADVVTAMIAGLSRIQGESSVATALQSNSTPLSTNITPFITTQNAGFDNTKPQAFLNWVLLDNQFNYVASSSGFRQVGSDDALTPITLTNLPLNSSGYLYIYTSNATPNVDVFFDNLQVTHTRGPLLEEGDYYPFGLTMAGISDRALKSNYAEKKYRYSGKELNNKEFSDGSGLEEYDFGARMQDPQIGRWESIDPKAYKYMPISPYAYCANDPLRWIDPDGATIQIGNMSVEDRNMIVGLLQKLTGDKIRYNEKTHNIDIVTMANDKKNKLKSGTALIRALVGHEMTATINYNKKQVQSGGNFDNDANSQNGKGSNIDITLAGVNVQTQVATKDGTKSEAQPQFLVLGEELIHGLIGMDGYDRKDDNIKENTYIGVGGKTKTEKQPLRELEAHGIGNYQPFGNPKRTTYPTENSIRAENGLPQRVAYEPEYISETHN